MASDGEKLFAWLQAARPWTMTIDSPWVEMLSIAEDALSAGRLDEALLIVAETYGTPTELTPYASRTGTRKNLLALRMAGWRLLVSATGVLRHEGFPYALDNGAWTAFQKGGQFDEALFLRALVKLGREADFVVVPDIVEGGLRSLEYSLSWLDRVHDQTLRALIAVQDGMTTNDLRPLLGPRVGIFIGGSTKFKEQTMPAWARYARECGAWCHVGRVNTARRIAQCAAVGVTSFDGTSASRFVKTLPLLDGARRQLCLGLENK